MVSGDHQDSYKDNLRGETKKLPKVKILCCNFQQYSVDFYIYFIFNISHQSKYSESDVKA